MVAIRTVAVVPFEDGPLARKQETCGWVVLEKCLETVEWEIAAYMQGRKLAVVSMMGYSKMELGGVVHRNQVRAVALVVGLASCSFAAAAVVVVAAATAAAVVVAGAQELVGFAVDRQMNQTWT